MTYELYYWPGIQGRGEFVRLALEAAGADYVDVARARGGTDKMLRRMGDASASHAPFAPPFLAAGREVIAQTANILWFLGPRLGLAPTSESGRLWAQQLQLTVTDLVAEIHDTHHPIAGSLYYADQRREAKRRSGFLLGERLPKYLGYFEQVLARRPRARWLAANSMGTIDLSLFQVLEGLRFAFPHAQQRLEKTLPRLVALHDRVAGHARIKAYLASPRRVPFNNDGIFRHYPELDR